MGTSSVWPAGGGWSVRRKRPSAVRGAHAVGAAGRAECFVEQREQQVELRGLEQGQVAERERALPGEAAHRILELGALAAALLGDPLPGQRVVGGGGWPAGSADAYAGAQPDRDLHGGRIPPGRAGSDEFRIVVLKMEVASGCEAESRVPQLVRGAVVRAGGEPAGKGAEVAP